MPSPRLRALLIGFALLSLAAPAFAGGPRGQKTGRAPRLGTFVGSNRSAAVSEVGDFEVKDTGRLRLSMRPRQGRLHVRLVTGGGKGNEWRQSFLVTGDAVQADGTRVITYARPIPKSRTGRHNERVLGAWLTAESESGAAAVIKGMEGGGTILLRGDQVTWNNYGSGTMRTGGAAVEMAWDETFDGTRPARTKSAR